MQGHREFGLAFPGRVWSEFSNQRRTGSSHWTQVTKLRKGWKSLPESISRCIVLRPSASSLSCRALQKVPLKQPSGDAALQPAREGGREAGLEPHVSLQGGSLSTRPLMREALHFCLHSLGLRRWVEGDAALTVGSVLLSSCMIDYM